MVEPRAVTLDDESLRAFATSSLSSELEPLLLAGYGTRWYTGTGRKLAEVSANAMRFGYSCRNGFSQPELVALLAERVRNAPHGRVLFQTCLDDMEERAGRVVVRLSGLAISSPATEPIPPFARGSGSRSKARVTRNRGSSSTP